MEPLGKIAEYFLRFPGIGPRQARRFAYFILRQDPEWVSNLIEQLQTIRSSGRLCTLCHRHFIGTKEIAPCPICADVSRTTDTLMVVEKEVDFESIEKSRAYQGRYYILGGTISLMNQTDTSGMFAPFLKRIENDTSLKEIILALSATTEGDDTVAYLKERLELLAATRNIRITTLGRGLSTGSEIEYVDSQTLKDALSRRTASPTTPVDN